jgi:unsaturated chondroitin disaccharide hydrolase
MDKIETWVDGLWNKLAAKLEVTAIRSRDKLPYTVINGVHNNEMDTRPDFWTNGYWGGLMWLMYTGTKNEEFRKTAERSEELLDCALFQMYDKLIHDVGCMWHITAGANFRLTGNRQSLLRNLTAANALASRYNIKGGFIRAWEGGGTSIQGWSIIDCMINIPLLYWASEHTKDGRFKYIAMAHADMTVRDHVRADGSVNHIVTRDTRTGEVLGYCAGQGYETGSSWSRGQAWAVNGFPLSYRYTGKREYLDTAKKVANYFIANVCDDWLPKCDFRSPKEPVIYDSTASFIAASGLLELTKLVCENEKSMYFNAAVNLIKAGARKYADWSLDNDSIIQMGTGSYPRPEKKTEIHIPVIYGDFYFAECIYKLKSFKFSLW